jgi:hypothetical protein
MVALLVLLTLLLLIFGFFAKKGFLRWRAYERERDVYRLRLAYNTMNDGGVRRKRKSMRFGCRKYN